MSEVLGFPQGRQGRQGRHSLELAALAMPQTGENLYVRTRPGDSLQSRPAPTRTRGPAAVALLVAVAVSRLFAAVALGLVGARVEVVFCDVLNPDPNVNIEKLANTK